MKFPKKLAALLLGAALFLTGCGGPKGAVTVDGVAFTLEDYEVAYRASQNLVTMQLALMYGITQDTIMADEEMEKEYRAQIAEMAKMQLVQLGVLEHQMKKAHLELDTKAVDDMVAQQEEQMGGAEALDESLAQMHMTREQFWRFTSVNQMMLQLEEHLKTSDPKAVRQYFDDSYLRCKHVLIKDETGEDAQKEALAKDIAAKAQAGEDFDALVKEYGEDPGMEGYPDGYVFTEGDMVPEFYEGSKALKPDSVSDPVKSAIGWHIIQRLPLRDEDFEAQKDQVEQMYLGSVFNGWMEKAKVEMSDEATKMDYVTLGLIPTPDKGGDETAPEQGAEKPADGKDAAPEQGAEKPAEQAPTEKKTAQ